MFWDKKLPKNLGLYHWQEHPEVEPIIVRLTNDRTWFSAIVGNGSKSWSATAGDGGRWCPALSPDPKIAWDRPWD